MKDCYRTKYLRTLINFFLNNSAAFKRALRNIMKMIEARDKNKVCFTVLPDLLKAFDCIKRDLLIVNLHASGFHFKSLRVFKAFLNNRVQVTKVVLSS